MRMEQDRHCRPRQQRPERATQGFDPSDLRKSHIHDNGVDFIGLLEQIKQLHQRGPAIFNRLCSRINRIGGRSKAGNERIQSRLQMIAEERHIEPSRRTHICRPSTRSARGCDYRHLAHPPLREAGKTGCRCQHFFLIKHPVDTVPGKDGVVRGIGSGQMGGMRNRSALPSFRTSHLHDDHWHTQVCRLACNQG